MEKNNCFLTREMFPAVGNMTCFMFNLRRKVPTSNKLHRLCDIHYSESSAFLHITRRAVWWCLSVFCCLYMDGPQHHKLLVWFCHSVFTLSCSWSLTDSVPIWHSFQLWILASKEQIKQSNGTQFESKNYKNGGKKHLTFLFDAKKKS